MVDVVLDDPKREALRVRYRAECDKRIRPVGSLQYLTPNGRLARLLDDPYTRGVEREPLTDHVTLLMVGGGFAGLCVGARLRDAGVEDFRIIDSGGDFGGVWYWNRFPGVMCDTASMIYLPLLEETGHTPSMKYVQGPEIREHAQRIGRQYKLYEKAVFSTQVTSLRWMDTSQHWVVETDRGDRITAKYVATGVGPLDRLKLPCIPGLDSFAGHSFHTSRWDYGYTGGSPDGGAMLGLADKRVGIIGTGATAVQCVPPLGRDSGELFVFQRTSSAVDERNNEPIDPEWFRTLGPGWQREWLVNFATVQTGGFAEQDLVDDGWTELGRRIRDRWVENHGGVPDHTDPVALTKAYEDSDDEKTEQIRRRVDTIVDDPATAELLKAWYRQLCKRPCFHDEYLQAFNRPSVHLVDTDGKGVERIDATGVWVAGVHYDLDCIVYASGFEFGADYTSDSAFEITGRDGMTLVTKWADGMETFQGMFARGFPNLFIVGFRQGMNLGANATSNYTEASLTLAAVVKHAEETGAAEVETSEEAQRSWVEAIEGNPRLFIGGSDCTPGYYNNEGDPDTRVHKLSMGGHPLGPVGFLAYIDEWRKSGRFEGLEFQP